jgi:NAD(P)-dependent dehydrogenase (short-subunit alcohol dehydrogenase family)
VGMTLDGRVAVVTGSTRSIGRGIAEMLLAEGATVVLSGRSRYKGEQALKEIGIPERAFFLPCDCTRQQDVEALVDRTAERFGRLDILVNNAGGSRGFALVHELSDDAWRHALDFNLNACFWATRRALPHMVRRGWGRIVNMSSIEGKQAKTPMTAHYVTVKHAIHGLTKATAHEYARQGITCNAICPGAVDTDAMRELGPLVAEAAGITYEEFLDGYARQAASGRLTTVEEIAAVARLLVGEPGGGITGALLSVDGGATTW